MNSGVVCKFFEQGRCRYGANCRNIHPSGGQATGRFGSATQSTDIPYKLDREVIRKDLAEERPSWILSAYGPGRDAPEQLFGGPAREQSFEEMRLYYMQGLAAGNPQAALNDLETLNRQAQISIQQAVENPDAAIQFIVAGGNKHPNRIDICQQSAQPGGSTGQFEKGGPRNPAFGGQPKSNAFGGQTGAFGASAPQSTPFGAPSQPAAPAASGFGQPSQPAAGGFGQASALGQKPNPWGQSAQPATTSAFGQPSQPAAGFGQASALGAKPNPWGQTAKPAGAPAFGQPSQPGSGPAFGQPSQSTGAFGHTASLGQKSSPWGQSSQPAGGFGQPSQPAGGFGQASQPTASSAFGQPSQPAANGAFGQPSQPAASGAFGQPSQPASGFGQTANLGAKASPWGAPASGQPSQPQQNTNAFGAPSAAQQPAAANPFGQTSNIGAKPSPWGQPAAPAAASAFGQPQQPAASNPFGQPQQPAATNPFGQPQQPQQPAASNPFGQPQQPAPATMNPTMQAATASGANQGHAPPSAADGLPNPYGPNATRQHPPVSSYSSRNPDGSLRMFKGRAVHYQVLPGTESTKAVPVIAGPGGAVTKIWFPDGPPGYNRDTEALDERSYQDQGVLALWEGYVKHGGRFADGVMPEVPPKREWCVWDF